MTLPGGLFTLHGEVEKKKGVGGGLKPPKNNHIINMSPWFSKNFVWDWKCWDAFVRFSRHPFFDLAVLTPLPLLTSDFIAPQWTWSPALPPRRNEPFRLQTQVSAWLWGRAEREFSRCFTPRSQTPYLKLTATATLPTAPNRPGRVRSARRQIKYTISPLAKDSPPVDYHVM